MSAAGTRSLTPVYATFGRKLIATALRLGAKSLIP